VRFVSRYSVPAEGNAVNDDGRRLGVAIAGLTLDGHAAAEATHRGGWQPPECGWRWTTGDATLDVEGARTLAFSVVLTAVYWVTNGPQATRRAA
jgi:hypothetical protein